MDAIIQYNTMFIHFRLTLLGKYCCIVFVFCFLCCIAFRFIFGSVLSFLCFLFDVECSFIKMVDLRRLITVIRNYCNP